jgi:phage regulator Rha-like protein
MQKQVPVTVPSETIENKILLIRGHKVILDADLAILYGVTTKRLNEQIKRNKERFPIDFMFRITDEEKKQVVAICDHLSNLKFSHINPHAFTEHGAIMVANVLNTRKAIEISLAVVRTFVKLRTMLASHKKLCHKLTELEGKIETHDEKIQTLIKAIRELMHPSKPTKKRVIGFRSWNDKYHKQ